MVIVNRMDYKDVFYLMTDKTIDLSTRFKTSLKCISEIHKFKQAEKQGTLLNRCLFTVNHKNESKDKIYFDGIVGVATLETNIEAGLCVFPSSNTDIDYLVDGTKLIVNDYCINKLHLKKLYTRIDFGDEKLHEFMNKFGYTDRTFYPSGCFKEFYIYEKDLSSSR